MADALLVSFGSKVARLRRERGLSQEELAELTGLHRTYISGIERGERNIGLKNIGALAQAFGISLSTLMDGVRQ